MPEVASNGVRLSYEIHGEGDPVVLVCGTVMPASLWSLTGIVDRFQSAGYQVITFDLRGIPPSEVPPPPYDVDDMVADSVGLIESVVSDRCHIMGNSLGGLISQEVARRRPDLCRSAIMWVGIGNFSTFGRELMRATVDECQRGDMAPSLITMNTLRDCMPPVALQDDEQVESVLKVLASLGEPPTNPGRLGHYSADLAWAELDHLTKLKELQVPALAIAHEHDVYFPPSHVRRAAEEVPNCEYVEIRNASHIAFHKVDEILPHMLAFLAKH
jgi:pimeloyl-ACP methyl ester carboxylesterase